MKNFIRLSTRRFDVQKGKRSVPLLGDEGNENKDHIHGRPSIFETMFSPEELDKIVGREDRGDSGPGVRFTHDNITDLNASDSDGNNGVTAARRVKIPKEVRRVFMISPLRN